MHQPLSYRHRVITDEDLVFIRKLIADHPGSSRRNLSERLCEAWNWVQANGALRSMVCRGLMLMLHRQGLIELPPVRWVNRNPFLERSTPDTITVDEAQLSMALAELGVSVWARHLDGRLSGGHHDAHGNCKGPTALAGADRHRASAVVHAPASSALAMRSRDSEPARRSTAAQRLGGEPVVSVLWWQVSRDAGAARRFCC